METLSEQAGFDQFCADGGYKHVSRDVLEAEAVLEEQSQPDWETLLNELHDHYAHLDYLKQNNASDTEISEVEAAIEETVTDHSSLDPATYM